MNKICIAALALAVLHVVDATVSDFFNNIPDEVSNALSIAWSNIVNSVKKPVRMKRLGRVKRRRHPSTTTTSTATEETMTNTHVMIRKMELPVLPAPWWLSLDDWKHSQKPRFVFGGITSESLYWTIREKI